jgi:hypothetical protein
LAAPVEFEELKKCWKRREGEEEKEIKKEEKDFLKQRNFKELRKDSGN